MSLTSYRAAPPRGGIWGPGGSGPWFAGAGGLVRLLAPLCVVASALRAVFWPLRGMKRENLIGSGGDLLSHVLRRSTIGAAGLNGRVRDGTGCFPRAVTTRPWKPPIRGLAGSGRSSDGAGPGVHPGRRPCPFCFQSCLSSRSCAVCAVLSALCTVRPFGLRDRCGSAPFGFQTCLHRIGSSLSED